MCNNISKSGIPERCSGRIKCLVLGSAGQIGTTLCQFLKDKGHEVIAFDIAGHPSMDLRIPNRVDPYIDKADFVFFLSFDVGGSTYLKKYQHTHEFLDNNIKIMSNTFDSLARYNKPFIFMSSQMSNMGEYSSYGALKKVGEYYTKTLGAITVKLWNVYGIEKDPNKTHVITDFIKMALEKKEIRIKTDGEEERQFLYSTDCSNALLFLAENYSTIPRDEELHITTFKWIKIIDIANIISKLCGNIPVIQGTEVDSVQRGRRNEANPYILSMWQPKIEIEDGIKEMIEYYQGK